jgi:large subunit ribosomal protein L6
MSRIGKQPVEIPDGVTVSLDGLTVNIKGPMGELTQTMPEGVTLSEADGAIVVAPTGGTRMHRSRWGLVRALVANMVVGVTSGYEKQLDLVGVGYRAASKGKGVELQVGFSHTVQVDAPEGVTIEVPTPTEILVKGIDKAVVGQVAANIRKVRPPEPYKGKGIKYRDERIRRKAGKAAAR